jgi:hypothetical protein
MQSWTGSGSPTCSSINPSYGSGNALSWWKHVTPRRARIAASRG